MQAKLDTERSLVLSYLGLRKSLGIIGMLLPIVLAVGKILFESPGLLDGISAYYYSVMRDVFVGSMFAMGVFLFSYRYARQDDFASNLAGASAIGLALFPTAPAGATAQQLLIGQVHLVFSGVFFLILAFFSLVLFRKTDRSKRPTRKKLQRNRVYLFSGIVIVVCLVLLVLMQYLPGISWLQPLHPVFWLESLGIFAFGIAWFVKGEAILKDAL